LLALGAIDSAGSVTQRGLRLHRIPIDPWYGRLLVEAEARGCLAAMIELVACLSNNPPVPLPEVDPMRERPPCDASALLEWYRTPSKVKGIHAEVKSTVARLRRMFDVKDSGQPAEVSHLLQTVIAADPRAAHIPRMRKQRVSWASGGTELELGRESCAAQAHSPQAIVVLGTRAIGSGRKRKLLATRASAIPLNWLVAAGLGTVRVSAARIERRKLVARLERIYAGKVIHSVEGPVVGDAARQGAARLYLEGRWFAGALRRSRERVMRNQLAATLAATPGYEYLRLSTAAAPPNLEQWIVERLAELGLDSGDDLDLISEQDLLFPDVPAEVAPLLDSEFPLRVDLGDCTYAVNYDLAHRQVLLQIVKGRRNTPPPLSFLPKFRGFRVCVEVAGGIRVLRERR
jgi:ATP-dependent helicase HrpB